MDKPKRGRPKKTGPPKPPPKPKHKKQHMYVRRFVGGQSKTTAENSYLNNEPMPDIIAEKQSYAGTDKKERARVKKAYYRKKNKALKNIASSIVGDVIKSALTNNLPLKADGTPYKSIESYNRAMKAKDTRAKKQAKRTKK